MSTKRKVLSLVGLSGLAVVVVACGLLLGDDSKRTSQSPSKTTAKSDVMVSAFGGGKQPASETVQFLILGSRNTTITSLRGDDELALPGYLNLPTEGKAVQFRFSVDGKVVGDGQIVGTLSSLASEPDAIEFLKTHAISLTISDEDIRLASKGPINKFIFLSHRRPTEKWAGHFGTLDQPGRISSEQHGEILKNLKESGFLLAELVIAKQE